MPTANRMKSRTYMCVLLDYDSALLAHNTTTLFTIFSALCASTFYSELSIWQVGRWVMYVCTFVSALSVGLCVYTLKKGEFLSINFDERNREGEGGGRGEERERERGKERERERERGRVREREESL